MLSKRLVVCLDVRHGKLAKSIKFVGTKDIGDPVAIGAQRAILSMDIRRVEPTRELPSGYEIVINGGVTPTGIDALWWAKKGEKLGAGVLVINSIDADGPKDRYYTNR